MSIPVYPNNLPEGPPEYCTICGGTGMESERGGTCFVCHGSKVTYEGYGADRALVMEALHFSGSLASKVPANVSDRAYTMADGYGDFFSDPEGLAAINDGYDWSHIRDSSEAGIRRMADYLRSSIFGNGPIDLDPSRVAQVAPSGDHFNLCPACDSDGGACRVCGGYPGFAG